MARQHADVSLMAVALIVDNSVVSRMPLARFLAELGFDVREADDGEAALADLEYAGLPDLVFCEWEMEPMNGAGFLQHVRNDPVTVRLPIFILTAVVTRQAVVEAAALGIQGYIIKPFDHAEVAARIAALDLVGHGTRVVNARCRALMANRALS